MSQACQHPFTTNNPSWQRGPIKLALPKELNLIVPPPIQGRRWKRLPHQKYYTLRYRHCGSPVVDHWDIHFDLSQKTEKRYTSNILLNKYAFCHNRKSCYEYRNSFPRLLIQIKNWHHKQPSLSVQTHTNNIFTLQILVILC